MSAPRGGARGPLRWLRGPAALSFAAMLALLPLRFPGALPGPLVVSADDHLTVHHVFQDEPGGRVRHPALSDPAVQLAALEAEVLASLRRGQAPLWSAALYGGAPLLADAQSAPLSPRTLLQLCLPAAAANDLTVALVLLWAGMGVAALARAALRLADPHEREITTAAMIFAGTGAMLSPYLSVWLLHPHAVAAASIPWMLRAVALRQPTALALATFGVAIGGHPGTLVHGVGLTVVVLFALLAGPLRRRWAGEGSPAALTARLLLGLGVGLLLAGPLLLPLAEQAARSTTLQARVGARLEPVQLLDLLWPGWLGHPAHEDARPGLAWADGQLHPGLVVLPALLFAARHAALARGALALWALCLGASLLGLPGPFAHGRLASLFATLLPAAAALGLAALLRQTRPGRRAPLAALIIGISVLTGILVRWSDQGALPAAAHRPPPAAWAAALAEQLASPPRRALGLGWAAQPNTGALAGLRDLRGYDLPVSTDTHRLMAALSPRPEAPWYPVRSMPPLPLLQALGVGALLLPPADPDRPEPYPEAAALPAIPLPTGPLRVVAVPAPAPRAWIAAGAWRAASPEDALAALRAPEAWWRPGVELALPLPEGEGPPIEVEVSSDGDGLLELFFEPADQPRLLVVNEAWSPGWRADLSGAPTPTLRAGGVWISALLPPGADRLRLRYRPDGWIWGLRAGALGLVLLALLAARGQRARAADRRRAASGGAPGAVDPPGR